MEIELAEPILPVAVAVDKARQNRLTRRVDYFADREEWKPRRLFPTTLNLPPSMTMAAFSNGGFPVPSIKVPP